MWVWVAYLTNNHIFTCQNLIHCNFIQNYMLEYLAFLALTMHVNLYEIDTHNTNTYIWLLLTLYMIYCQPILNGWMVRTSITVANVISNYGQRYQLKFLWKEEVKFKFELLDWHKTQTKYRSESQPILAKNALILSA